MLLEHDDTILIFDPETVRIWEGDYSTKKILEMLDQEKSIPEIADALNQNTESISKEVEDLHQKGILEKKEKRGPTIFSVSTLFHGLFQHPFPSEVLRKGAHYLAELSKGEGENEAVISVLVQRALKPELDVVREILDEISAHSHTDLLLSVVTPPQYVEHVLNTRIDHVTVEVSSADDLSFLESAALDKDVVTIRIAEGGHSIHQVILELENMGLVNFEIPYTFMDIHKDFLARLSFENFSDIPLSDKIVDLLVSILSRNPLSEPHCSAGVKIFFCNNKGEIYPCHRAEQSQFLMGTFGTEYDHRNSPLSHTLRGYQLKECTACWTRTLCGGGCFLHQGDCLQFQHFAEHVICMYPDIITEMRKRMAQPGTDRLDLVVSILERIRQNYVFSWCKLQ